VTRASFLGFTALVTITGCAPSFDTSAPGISDFVLGVKRDTSATFIWLTSERANSLLEYGETTDYGTVEIDNHYLETHVVTIKNLTPLTTYHVRAMSYDLFGNGPSRSKDLEFTTEDVLPLPDLVITEVHPSPSVTTGEFIELVNNGIATVDLVGFKFSDGDSTDTLQAFGGGETLLGGGDYAVIVDADYVADTYSFPAGTVLMTTSDTTLGNGLSADDPISLFLPDQSVTISTYGTPLDAFDSIPLTPTTGTSVGRTDPNAEDVPGNWCLSTDPSGSSPGQANPSC
jgi:hypothetical protein